ncbi:MAG: hypothetical protein MJZ98_00665 [Paludibacteraceae bacterium]|nr:hypothetical protein [Paludibacteraceae bacterium]
MTIIEALRKSVSNYPLKDDNVEPHLIKRGLSKNAEFTAEVANSAEYELAYADTLKSLCNSFNLSQSGASVTVPNIRPLISIANAIYARYGEALISDEGGVPTVKIL